MDTVLLDTGLEDLNNFTPSLIDAIHSATLMAIRAHFGQNRRDGTPYVTHPIRVANLLLKSGIDNEDAICAALLHDVLEDSKLVNSFDIKTAFGANVLKLVKVLTKPGKDVRHAKRKYFEGIWYGPLYAVDIKIADRIDNLLTFFAGNPENKWKEKYINQTYIEVVPLLSKATESLAITLMKELWSIEKIVRDDPGEYIS